MSTMSRSVLPTLTEVVRVEPTPMPSLPEPPLLDAVLDAGHPPPPDEQHLTQRVLADVQRQIDLMLEYRLREALAPAMARLTEALVHEARSELASTLRDVVARAVAQELGRQRGR
ncbi:hypothetical protein MW290_12215 [Aquincola tertiaricarbonis]|uniref:Uncharacterized protein n=1 Tax=Aquincola tertiaricarbonis TaxID=391953 RepID=A0ABY4S3S9_AQUTE|nr:hypothetical protein [Aquincola tertiaricarbonis]URI06662.1 hypothetical protein MW290_12215 [Aquincola tertiaricarbonis]